MVGRVKFKIWSETQRRWRTVHVLHSKVRETMTKLKGYGIKFEVVTERVDSLPEAA